MKNKLFEYINDRFDNDGVLVDGDEVYEAFKTDFDNGQPVELIDEVMSNFIKIHDLTNVLILWEGNIA